jgi:hypothetical protein
MSGILDGLCASLDCLETRTREGRLHMKEDIEQNRTTTPSSSSSVVAGSSSLGLEFPFLDPIPLPA